MTKKQANPIPSKSKALAYFEYVLLAVCLAVIALRTTFTEGPVTQPAAFTPNISNSLYSLSVSTMLILAFFLWIIWSIYSGILHRRFDCRFYIGGKATGNNGYYHISRTGSHGSFTDPDSGFKIKD